MVQEVNTARQRDEGLKQKIRFDIKQAIIEAKMHLEEMKTRYANQRELV